MRKSALSIAAIAVAAIAVLFWTRSPPVENIPPKAAPAAAPAPAPVREAEHTPAVEPAPPPPKAETKVAERASPAPPGSCAALAMQENKKWREATLERSRVAYAMQMSGLATALQISPEQADKVFDILAQQSLRSQDTYAFASADMAAAWGGIKNRQDENRRAADEDLTQLLGAAKTADLRQYQQNAPIRLQVNQLQAALAGTPAALRPDQIAQLTDALIADRAAFRAEGAAREFPLPRGGGVTIQSYADEGTTYLFTRGTQAHDAAASALSPVQLARFDELQRLELEQRTAVNVSLEAQWKAAKDSGPAALVPAEPPAQARNIPAACARSQEPSANPVPDTRKLLADANYRAARLKLNHVSVAIDVIDQAKVLHLSQSETDKLTDLLAEQRVRQEEALPPMGSAGRQQAFAELRRKFDDEREQLLGPEKFEQWKKYRDSRRARTEVYVLRSQLAASTQPLRDDQVEPLVEAVDKELKRLDEEEESSASDSPATPFSSVPGQDAVEIDRQLERFKAAIERMHDSVALLLMPEQLARWDGMMQLELGQERARNRIERVETDLMKQTATTKL